jgi:hypothetical protein
MRDTVGAIHNLQHLLGSVRVGPRALARVVPDVHASCGPMITAAEDMVMASRSPPLDAAVAELAELVRRRMRELEATLARVSDSAFRASDRLNLESALTSVVRDLDGALELVELLVEASATGCVPVAVSDVIRESANRVDTGSGRGRRLRVTFEAPASAVLVRVNPRLALRLFAFAAALAGGKEGVHVAIALGPAACALQISSPSDGHESVLVAFPPLIELSRLCARDVAKASGAELATAPGERTAVLTLPLDPGD